MNFIKGIAFFTYNGNLNETKGTCLLINLTIVNTLPMHYAGTLTRLKKYLNTYYGSLSLGSKPVNYIPFDFISSVT